MSDKNHNARSVVIHHQHLDITPSTGVSAAPEVEESSDNGQLVFTMPQDGSLKQAIDDFQRSFIVNILTKNEGNQAAAARDLGVNRSNFYRLLKRLEVSE
jgi:anaerobic nitric oxide reductase transcription regulator